MVRAAIGSLVEVEAPAPPPLLRCVSGDRAGWRALHRQYYPVAAAFLRKLGIDERELEDACQDVFLQMFRYLGRFRGEADTSTWLYRLCITQARRTRLRQRVTRALENVLSRVPSEALVSSSFCEPSAQRRIASALDQLSAKQRRVFVLYEMEGLPGKRVAEIEGCTEASLWRRLHEARQVFRDALAGSQVDP